MERKDGESAYIVGCRLSLRTISVAHEYNYNRCKSPTVNLEATLMDIIRGCKCFIHQWTYCINGEGSPSQEDELPQHRQISSID